MDENKLMFPGNASCPGCGASLAVKLALQALGKDTMMVVPASCMAVIQGLYPNTCFRIPLVNVAFASAASD